MPDIAKLKGKKKIIWCKYLDLAAAVAHSLDIPREDAMIIVKVIFKYIAYRILKDRRVVIKRFGRFKIVKKRSPLHNKALPLTTAFKPAWELRRIIQDPEWHHTTYGYKVCIKIRRLRLEGTKTSLAEAQRCLGLLHNYLKEKPKTTAWLIKLKHMLPDMVPEYYKPSIPDKD